VRVVRLDFLGLGVLRLGVVIAAGVLVELRQRHVIGRLLRTVLDDFLVNRLGLGRVVQLVGPVGGGQILQRRLLPLLVGMRVVGALAVIGDGLLDVAVVGWVPLPGRFVQLVVAVAKEEV